MHYFEAVHCVVYFNPAVDARTGNGDHKLSRDITIRHLERTSGHRIVKPKVDARQYFEHVVLPEQYTPVWFTAQSNHVSFVILRTESYGYELFG